MLKNFVNSTSILIHNPSFKILVKKNRNKIKKF